MQINRSIGPRRSRRSLSPSMRAPLEPSRSSRADRIFIRRTNQPTIDTCDRVHNGFSDAIFPRKIYTNRCDRDFVRNLLVRARVYIFNSKQTKYISNIYGTEYILLIATGLAPYFWALFAHGKRVINRI